MPPAAASSKDRCVLGLAAMAARHTLAADPEHAPHADAMAMAIPAATDRGNSGVLDALQSWQQRLRRGGVAAEGGDKGQPRRNCQGAQVGQFPHRLSSLLRSL